MIGLVNLYNPIFKYDKKGFTSIINQIIDICIEHYINHNNYELIIDDLQILEFYDRKNNLINHDYLAGDFFLNSFFDNKTLHNLHNAHTIADLDNLKLRKKILSNILNLKDEYLNQIEIKKNNLNLTENTLALQIRGTDKFSEIPKIDDKKIINKINQVICDYNLDKIFLCTDDNYYLNLLLNNFGDKILFSYENIISYTGNPIHFTKNKSNINKEVLIDVYLLSKCNYFLYSFSNVSYLALTLGCDTFKFIKNFNYED